jgi:hypothetical protein
MENSEDIESGDKRLDDEDMEYGLPTGIDELFYALAEALRTKKSKESIAALIEQYAKEVPVAGQRRYRAMLWSYAFTVLVLVSVGSLGYFKVISGETAGALLGTVLGAVFYGRHSR